MSASPSEMSELRTIRATLDAVGEVYQLLSLQDGALLCVTQRGGRVLGIFPSENAQNLLWVNESILASPEALAVFKQTDGWNLGGERIWIAPEIQYIIRDRTNFWGTHRLPPAIDPGQYTLTVLDDGGLALTQALTLTAYNLAQGEKSLYIRRRIFPVPDPLRMLKQYAELMDGVQYIGYSQEVLLRQEDDAPILSEVWNLVQLRAGGKLYLPLLHDVEAERYFGDVPAEALQPLDGRHLCLSITGQQQYKIGYKAACVTGRMAYLNTLPTGESCLLVRDFTNNPSATYSEEPPDAPGVNGFSVHVYNDGGGFGGFGEMEASGQAIGGNTGRSASEDRFNLWAYIGSKEKVSAILTQLTGVRL